jgi:transposase InsO family protein
MAKEASVEQKLAMVLAAEQPGVKLKDLCAEMHVHRDTLNEWRRRFRAEGIGGLVPRSRRPHRSPNQTPSEVEEAIVRLRKELPVENGADVIGWHLRRVGHADVPSDRTIHRVLVRRGQVNPQPQKRPKTAWRRFEFDRPNECWQIDATDWRLADGRPVTVMDVIDDHSRVVASLRAASHGATTGLALETLFEGGRRWGLPELVLSDNGLCFAGPADGRGASTFETVLATMGIRVVHARPYHPQTCGKIESFHKSLKRWLATQPLATTIEELQAQLDWFADYYNHHRRHGATGEFTPGERHAASDPAQPAAGPVDLPEPTPALTITAAAVGRNGTVRIGQHWRASVGTEHAGRRLTVIRYGHQAVILDSATVIARHHLDPDRRYLPSGRPRGGPRRRPY